MTTHKEGQSYDIELCAAATLSITTAVENTVVVGLQTNLELGLEIEIVAGGCVAVDLAATFSVSALQIFEYGLFGSEVNLFNSRITANKFTAAVNSLDAAVTRMETAADKSGASATKLATNAVTRTRLTALSDTELQARKTRISTQKTTALGTVSEIMTRTQQVVGTANGVIGASTRAIQNATTTCAAKTVVGASSTTTTTLQNVNAGINTTTAAVVVIP